MTQLPQSPLQAQPFIWPVRVYYEDTDSAGVVYYANYLRFFERARTEWLRAAGFELHDLVAQYQIAFVVRSIAVEYRMPARLNDALSISAELGSVGASQIRMIQKASRGSEVLVEAQVRLACVDTVEMKPVRMPTILSAKIGGKTT